MAMATNQTPGDLFDPLESPSSSGNLVRQDSLRGSSEDIYGQSAEEWRHDPIGAFQRWARSPYANDGKGFADNSIVTYSSMWGKFVRFCPKNPALADASVIESFLAALSGRVRAEKSIGNVKPNPSGIRRRYLSMLDKLQGYLVRAGIRKYNDAAPLLFELDRRLRALPRPLPVALTKDEDAALMRVVSEWPDVYWKDSRDQALLAILIGSGIKVSEARYLKSTEIHLDQAPPYIMVAAGRNERMVPLTETSVPFLKAWIVRRGRIGVQTDVCFPGDDFTALAPSTIYRIVASAIKKANLSPHHTGPSVLRHTFATRQIRAGQELHVLSAWLGHQQEASTAIYKFMVVDPAGARPV